MECALAVDVGGPKLAVGVGTAAGDLLARVPPGRNGLDGVGRSA